ncbi:MAG: hypothetical protein P8Z35_00735, partial [Ignavibacteriaceae bacterium]
ALILIFIIILPALIFSLVEIGSLNEREQVIEEIYNNQLDAILFSVNQYSEDIISNWRSKINLLLNEKASHPESFKVKANSFLSINKAISSIIFADSLDTKNMSELNYADGSDKITYSKNDLVEIKNFLKNYSAKIKKLYTYERGGYSKIETLPDLSTDSSTVFIFLLDDPQNLNNICIMTINPVKFVRDVLGSKIKEIAEDKFIITCSSLKAEKPSDFIFATDNLQNMEIQQRKNLWLIPNYQIGILLKGQTIEGLAKSRSTTNLILILILIIILIVGVYIVFKNIRKEMELAKI